MMAAHEGAREEEAGVGGSGVLSATPLGCRRSRFDLSERCRERGTGAILTADTSKSNNHVDGPNGGAGDGGENDSGFQELWKMLGDLCA